MSLSSQYRPLQLNFVSKLILWPQHISKILQTSVFFIYKIKTIIGLHIVDISTWHSFGFILRVRVQYILAISNQQINIH